MLDLESQWHADSGRRLLDANEGDVVVDVRVMIRAEPSMVWAHLTSPSLRSLWEGPLVIEEASPGGRRGVGTTAQCVTGRLATLEEIVDWQPYDHVGWRLAVPGLGPVDSSADLEPADEGTRVRLRWVYQGEIAPAAGELTRIRIEREAAYERLVHLIAGSLPVVEQQEVRL